MPFSVWIDGNMGHVVCGKFEAIIDMVPDIRNKDIGMIGAFVSDELLFSCDITEGVPRIYQAYGNEMSVKVGLEMAFEAIEDYVSIKLTGKKA